MADFPVVLPLYVVIEEFVRILAITLGVILVTSLILKFTCTTIWPSARLKQTWPPRAILHLNHPRNCIHKEYSRLTVFFQRT